MTSLAGTGPCRLRVAGPLPRALADSIRDRFTGVSIQSRSGQPTVLDLRSADQPALRALLTLLWDAGHDVLSVTTSEEIPS